MTTMLRQHPMTTDPMAAVGLGPIIAERTGEGFDTRPYTAFEVTPVTRVIGAEISGVTLGGDLDDETVAELRRALLEWKVLFFRDQDIDREQQRAFATSLGEIEQHPFWRYAQPGQTAPDVATLARGAGSAAFENNWHNDVTFLETPSKAAILRAVEVPPVGGDTLWADTGAAYDVLSDEFKARIDGLSAQHDWINTFGSYMKDDIKELMREDFPPFIHPVVRIIPETGRRVLFVNRLFTDKILGVSEAESQEILDGLYRHIQRPEFQVRLKWRPNTVAIWDNRTCQHYATSDYYPAPRVMDRISVVGERPLAEVE